MNFALVYPGEKTRFAITATLAILFWIVVILGTLGLALLYVLLVFVIYAFAQSAFISYLRGSAVKITPEQFPDLHARVAACCDRVGVSAPPDAYLLHADGLFNALATRFLGRNYIVLFTSVVDALDTHPEALNFYIGHELGHVHRKHLTWGPVLMPVAWLPLLGAALRRAQEYTCDRYGLASCASAADAKAGMAALAAGHSRWKHLNYAAYAAQRRDVTGFWASFHEFCSDYPWTAKRAYAIDELAAGREPVQPGRNILAGVLALLVPRVPGAGGAGLIVVIFVVGILAAIAVPAYQQYTQRVAMTALPLQLEEGRQAVQAYAFENARWPGQIDELALAPEFQLGKITVAVELLDEGRLVYRMTGGGFEGESLMLVPEAVVEDEQLVSLEWTCDNHGLPAKVLPSGCW